ncbi:SRPBCC family protein [Pseudonocardia kunmingensis]|uniref:Polyketide cyclase/dehydrase/lipid transport protein n=1 Tax=Pseudonocardia kunmingensis TaxID=630975 RepID=A0A543DPZ3_9PSEU|nr:SRPBCC family protein [Pseudonocardia kunmingensis]TQM11412.1 polyketide cyclase/dehydrase/lipid transport protein [Pseudonocardia kunmingensis]
MTTETTPPTLDVSGYGFTRRAWVAARPGEVYDLISTVSHISRWSPNAIRARYDEGAGPRPGAWFSGRNRRSGNEWDSRSQVEVAEPGSEFTYTVLGSVPVPIVRWRWTFTAYGSGTHVTQTWQLLAADPVLGSTYRDLDDLRDATIDSVEATLVSLASWVADRAAA